ncbi:hypothetical protein AAY473_011716 [Plecturocebus cupreus]
MGTGTSKPVRRAFPGPENAGLPGSIRSHGWASATVPGTTGRPTNSEAGGAPAGSTEHAAPTTPTPLQLASLKQLCQTGCAAITSTLGDPRTPIHWEAVITQESDYMHTLERHLVGQRSGSQSQGIKTILANVVFRHCCLGDTVPQQPRDTIQDENLLSAKVFQKRPEGLKTILPQPQGPEQDQHLLQLSTLQSPAPGTQRPSRSMARTSVLNPVWALGSPPQKANIALGQRLWPAWKASPHRQGEAPAAPSSLYHLRWRPESPLCKRPARPVSLGHAPLPHLPGAAGQGSGLQSTLAPVGVASSPRGTHWPASGTLETETRNYELDLLPPSLEARLRSFAVMVLDCAFSPSSPASLPMVTCLRVILAGTLCGSAVCSTSSSPPGPTTAPPGLPRVRNVVMATDSPKHDEGIKKNMSLAITQDLGKVLLPVASQWKVLKTLHQTFHGGIESTHQMTSSIFTEKSLFKAAQQIVKGCEIYQKNNSLAHGRVPPGEQ